MIDAIDLSYSPSPIITNPMNKSQKIAIVVKSMTTLLLRGGFILSLSLTQVTARIAITKTEMNISFVNIGDSF